MERKLEIQEIIAADLIEKDAAQELLRDEFLNEGELVLIKEVYKTLISSVTKESVTKEFDPLDIEDGMVKMGKADKAEIPLPDLEEN